MSLVIIKRISDLPMDQLVKLGDSFVHWLTQNNLYDLNRQLGQPGVIQVVGVGVHLLLRLGLRLGLGLRIGNHLFNNHIGGLRHDLHVLLRQDGAHLRELLGRKTVWELLLGLFLVISADQQHDFDIFKNAFYVLFRSLFENTVDYTQDGGCEPNEVLNVPPNGTLHVLDRLFQLCPDLVELFAQLHHIEFVCKLRVDLEHLPQ